MSRPRIVVVASCLALAIAGYTYWWRADDADRHTYVTQPVERGAIAAAVSATGTVNPVATVQVGTYVSGPIRAIDVDFNSPVTKGQRVAKIDPAPFEVKVRKAEASVTNARARVEKDRADLRLKHAQLDRTRALYARQLVSRNDLDAATSEYEQARAQLALDRAAVRQADADLHEARINLNYTDITSPVDGVVVSRNVDVGQTVAASFQTPTLFLIAQDLTKMQVNTNVSESDIGDVRADQAAVFTVDAYPGTEFHGTVSQVRNAPTIIQNVVTYDVVVAVDNSELRLKPGMTATVTITTAQRADAVTIPVRALRFNPAGATEARRDGDDAAPAHGGARVWVLRANGTLRAVPVRLGIRNDERAEILGDGLQPGDEVAVAFRRERARADAPRPPGFGRRHR